MYIDLIKLPAPPIAGGVWLDGAPPTPESLEGKVVLVDFFDIASVAYLESRPYLAEWHRKYRDFGVRVVGVHCPSYDFSRDPDRVAAEAKRLEIPYPVGIDGDESIRAAFGIQGVPSRYVIDIHGFLRFYEIGAEDPGQVELFLHQAVRERDIKAELPDLMPPVRKEDKTGGFTLPVTREIRALADVGNAVGEDEGVQEHVLPEARKDGLAYLEGPWRRAEESYDLEGTGAVRVPYHAAEVHAVMGCSEPTPVTVSLDGGEARTIEVHAPRPYELIVHEEVEQHELTVASAGPGLRLYGVQFVSRMPAGI